MQWSGPGAGWGLPQPSSPRCLPPCLWREGCGDDGPFRRDVAAVPRQKKDTAVACTLSSVWGQWRARLRADHKAARCHWRNNAVHSMRMAAQHAWMRIRTRMPPWRDLTSDLYRLQLFISFDFRDFGQAQHKPRLRAISFLVITLCGRYIAPTRAFPPPPFFAISLAVLVRIAAGMNVSGRGDVRNTCVHMCSNFLAPKRSR